MASIKDRKEIVGQLLSQPNIDINSKDISIQIHLYNSN